MATGIPAGSKATGQRIFLVGSGYESDGTARELQEFISYSENTGAAPTSTETLPSGRSQSTTGARPINTISIQLRFMPHLPDHQALANGTVTQLRFYQEERVLGTPGTAARAAIAADGEVTFSGTGHAGIGAVGDAIQIGNKDHIIIAIREKTSGAGVKTDKLESNKVFVRGTLSAAVTAAAYKIVSPELEATIQGTVTQAPRLGDIPNDVAGFRTGTFIFTPSANVPFLASPTAKAPTYS